MSNKMALEALKSELRESAITMANLPTEFGVACLTDAGAQRIAKALTDAVAALEAGGWLPIESAPKDCEILLFCKIRGVVRGRWNDCRYAKNPRPYWTHDRERVFGVAACRSDQPTRWMPLPTPPKD